MQKILAVITIIYLPYAVGNGFGDSSLTSNDGTAFSTGPSSGYTDTTRQTKAWYDGNGASYDQPVGTAYTASNPIPDCPTKGIFLKNNSPRQETFTVTFIDGSQHVLSILPNDTRCIHTTDSRKIQNISIFPFLRPKQTSVSNGSTSLLSTGYNGSGDSSSFSFNSSPGSAAPAKLPKPPLTKDQIKNYTKAFSQFFKDTLYYPLSQANKVCRTMTYSGYTLQCWKSNPDLTPWHTYLASKPVPETKPKHI